MDRLYKFYSYILIFVLLISLTGCQEQASILFPKGVVTFEERQLLFDCTALMLIVVLSVIIMSFVFAFHYRADNDLTEYKPEWCHNNFLEAIWWGVPCAIILILGTMTWISTHQLDPYRKLNYPGEVMNIKVVALPWKWLFIYPDYNIATVNHLVLANNQQVEFHLTTDNVPMSSFMVPQLGSQIYTMAGMRTRLHLVPTNLGSFKGYNTQYNGDGFAHMIFQTDVLEPAAFKQWAQDTIKKTKSSLSQAEYNNIRKASIGNAPSYYVGVESGLFMNIINSYMAGTHPGESKENKEV